MLLRCRATRIVAVIGICCAGMAAPAAAQSTVPVEGAAPQRLPAIQVAEAQPISDPLLDQVEEAIKVNGQRYLTANYHSPWQIFHGILAYRNDFELKVGNDRQSAIEWFATSEPQFDNQPLMMVTQHGAKFHPFTRPYAFEGHPGQTLALLSESKLPVDYQLKVNGRMVTIGDFLQNTMMEVNTREETTWVLWALINYFKVDAQWTNQWGQPWSIEALVKNEVAAHTPTRPCGGNHNLFVLTRARDKYVSSGRPLRGTWFEADQKIRQYIELARSLQNSDGSFSSNFYKGPGFSQDMNSRFNTTGHTMEFLSIALPQERLNEPWVRNAVNVLSHELIMHRKAAIDCGPLYHSVNALKNYRDRVRPAAPEIAAVIPVPETAVKLADTPVQPSPTTTGTPITTGPAVKAEVVPMVAPQTVAPPTVVSTVPAPMPTLVQGSPTEPLTVPNGKDPSAPRLTTDSITPTPAGPISALETLNQR